MTQPFHGAPCWYELSTSDIAAAQTFYAAILDWRVSDSGTPGMDYRLAKRDDAMVAGMMAAAPGMPTAWTLYFAVSGCDETFAQATALGAQPIVPPADIPNTGRFALLLDPQGAAFGILEPLPMPDGSIGGAFNQQKPGHGNWHEIITPDPAAALAFYGKLFGWTLTRSMAMGPDMTYHLIGWNGLEIGGSFAPNPPAPAYWKPYFGTDSTAAAVIRVPKAGGRILHGPDEVPGGTFTLQITDPQGVRLALAGPA